MSSDEDDNQFPGRKPGFGVRPLNFIERDDSDDEAGGPIPTGTSGPLGTCDKDSDEKGSSSTLALLPVFPDNLNWNEARERWVVWKPLFVRLLELRRNVKSQRDKETLLIARGGSLIQDIAFAQRPVPEEILQVGQGEELPAFDNLLKRCDHYFTANSHVAIDIERFRNLKQKADESFTSFTNRLRRLAALCGFGGDTDREVKMQILSGAVDRKLLIQQGVMYDKSLAELETYGMRLEMSRELFSGSGETKAKEEEKPEEVHVLQETRRAWKRDQDGNGKGGASRFASGRGYRGTVGGRSYQGNRQGFGERNNRGGGFRGSFEKKSCPRCAGPHNFGTCPADGKECRRCGKPNHFAVACRQGQKVNAIGSGIGKDYQLGGEAQVKVDDEWD